MHWLYPANTKFYDVLDVGLEEDVGLEDSDVIDFVRPLFQRRKSR